MLIIIFTKNELINVLFIDAEREKHQQQQERPEKTSAEKKTNNIKMQPNGTKASQSRIVCVLVSDHSNCQLSYIGNDIISCNYTIINNDLTQTVNTFVFRIYRFMDI